MTVRLIWLDVDEVHKRRIGSETLGDQKEKGTSARLAVRRLRLGTLPVARPRYPKRLPWMSLTGNMTRPEYAYFLAGLS